MDIKELEKIMIENSLIIRPIPLSTTTLREAYHKKDYPNGVVYYDERYKRNMLKETKIPIHAGKFIVEKVKSNDSTIRFKAKKYYNSIEEIIQDIDNIENYYN